MAAAPGDTVYEVCSVRVDLATKLARVEVRSGVLAKDGTSLMRSQIVRAKLSDELVAALQKAADEAVGADTKALPADAVKREVTPKP